MFDFIADLDEYFCEKYANYDKICVLPGYRMPKMHATKIDEFGRTYAYTLPANTMRLATQENKTELLQALKKQISDKTFSFSFAPLSFFAKWKNKCSKYGFVKAFKGVLSRYNLSEAEACEGLEIAPEIWKKICKGDFLPTKNLIFSLALTAHISMDDVRLLLAVCEYTLDYAIEKDVVVSYLIEQKVFNRDMVDAALAEYNVGNLFIK